MIRTFCNALAFSALLALCSGAAQAQVPAPLQFDFNGDNPWSGSLTDVMPSTPIDVLTTMEIERVGVEENGKPSGALVLKTEVGKVGLPWIATYSSGWLPLNSTELKGAPALQFDFWSSNARPVTVRLESFDAKKRRTGGVQTAFTSKAANTFERQTLDVAKMKADGEGKFSSSDPFVQLSFVVESPAWPDEAVHELRIDNLLLVATP